MPKRLALPVMLICASASLSAQSGPLTGFGVQAGNKVVGVEGFSGYGHGALYGSVQKFQEYSAPEVQVGAGACGAGERSYGGAYLIASGGGKTGAGIGIALQSGYKLGPVLVGLGGQAIAGTKHSHAEIFAFLGFKLD